MTSGYDIRLPRLRRSEMCFGVPDDEANEHHKALSLLEARSGKAPSINYPDVIAVTDRSPVRYRRAVETIACYFRREFRYDFVQYRAAESNGRDRAYMWTGRGCEEEIAIGACCFRWRKWKDHAPGWALAWIWFHPYERGQGHLSKAWPYFQARFGDFHVEPPLSPAMAAFLAKQAMPKAPEDVEALSPWR
jgi:hypothetical protein